MMGNKKIQYWWKDLDQDLPDQFVSDQRILEAERIKNALINEVSEAESDWQFRLRRAATLIETSLLAEDGTPTSIYYWGLAALIHETLGLLSSDDPNYHLLLSLLAWQLAASPSIALMLSLRISSRIDSPASDYLENLSIAFSQRDFPKLLNISNDVVSSGRNLREESLASVDFDKAIDAASQLSVGKSMKALADYIQFNSQEIPNTEGFSDLITLASSRGNARRFRVARLLKHSVDNFVASSSRLTVDSLHTLSDKSRGIIHAYLRQYPELWPSQQKAINMGLLNPKERYFVVAVPTSSGKTLCGELVIIQELVDNPDSTCFYIVPTRALVYEKTVELRTKLGRIGFQIAGVTGALQRDDIEASLMEDARVIVCTPEKLDLLVRHKDIALEDASIFIIDETQMVEDNDRGLGLEFVVTKLLLLISDARIVLLSATLPNAEDFGRWLAEGTPVASSEWRPTRQRFGCIELLPTPPRGSCLKLTLYDHNENLDGVEIQLRSFPRQPRSLIEGVIWAVDVFRTRGPILVFCMTKSRCEDIALRMIKQQVASGASFESVDEVENLRNRIRREIAPEFLLDQALEFRIAYHHADIPPRIRVELENVIAEGHIDVIISTTTLAEGVNLPISVVIFEDWMTHPDARKGDKPSPLGITKFINIAGRAGRAGKETEGLVLFYEPSRDNKQIKLDGDENTVAPKDHFIRTQYPAVKSRFLEMVSGYKIPDEKYLDQVWEYGDSHTNPEVRRALRQFGSVVLHMMEVIHLEDEELIDGVIDRSLLAVQSPETKTKAGEWFRVWMRHYRRVSLANEELRLLAMQVGLPLRALNLLYQRVEQDTKLLDMFEQFDESQSISNNFIKRCSMIISEVDELDWRPADAPHHELLSAWINGVSISSLTQIYSLFLPYKTRYLERTCNYATQQLSNMGAWGMYALTRVFELLLGEDNVPLVIKKLPLFAYFGVNSIPAALLCLNGVERIDAFRLGDAFQIDQGTPVTIPTIRSWIDEIGKDEFELILRGPDSRKIDDEIYKVLDLT